MKFGRFLKIGLPVIGVASLGCSTAIVATSCSNSDALPPAVVAANTLSSQLLLWQNGFKTNAQALKLTPNDKGEQNLSQGILASIKNAVDNFNNKTNKDVLSNLQEKSVILQFVQTPSADKLVCKFFLGTSDTSLISLTGADGKTLPGNFKVTITPPNSGVVPTVTVEPLTSLS